MLRVGKILCWRSRQKHSLQTGNQEPEIICSTDVQALGLLFFFDRVDHVAEPAGTLTGKGVRDGLTYGTALTVARQHVGPSHQLQGDLRTKQESAAE